MGGRLLRRGAEPDQKLRCTAMRAHPRTGVDLFVDRRPDDGVDELQRVLASEKTGPNELRRCPSSGSRLQLTQRGGQSELCSIPENGRGPRELGRLARQASQAQRNPARHSLRAERQEPRRLLDSGRDSVAENRVEQGADVERVPSRSRVQGRRELRVRLETEKVPGKCHRRRLRQHTWTDHSR